MPIRTRQIVAPDRNLLIDGRTGGAVLYKWAERSAASQTLGSWHLSTGVKREM